MTTAVEANRGSREGSPRRRKQRRWTAIEREMIYRTYTGHNAEALAERYGVHVRTIITMASQMRRAAAAGSKEPWLRVKDK